MLCPHKARRGRINRANWRRETPSLFFRWWFMSAASVVWDITVFLLVVLVGRCEFPVHAFKIQRRFVLVKYYSKKSLVLILVMIRAPDLARSSVKGRATMPSAGKLPHVEVIPSWAF